MGNKKEVTILYSNKLSGHQGEFDALKYMTEIFGYLKIARPQCKTIGIVHNTTSSF